MYPETQQTFDQVQTRSLITRVGVGQLKCHKAQIEFLPKKYVMDIQSDCLSRFDCLVFLLSQAHAVESVYIIQEYCIAIILLVKKQKLLGCKYRCSA